MFKALYSAWGLPLKDVNPDEITASFFSTIHPTEGLLLVEPRLFFACSNAKLKK